MVKINDDGTKFRSYVETNPGSLHPEIRFWPYWSTCRGLPVLKGAIKIINDGIYKKNHMCQKYFKTLPGRKTFDEVWSLNSLIIHYDPRENTTFYGARSWDNPTEITLSQKGLNRGIWVTVATLIHELAHIGGATGQNRDGTGSLAAEEALKHCGCAAHYDPNNTG